MRQRRRIVVQGIVQGVGFRPFVYGLAQHYALSGHVNNDAAGVTIEVEGEASSLDEFTRLVQGEPPPLASIDSVAWENLPTNGETSFVIEASHAGAEKQTFISPDVCLCDDCHREMLDPADRRFAYPFINCTNCGPRFTIIKDVPYDRPATTMAPFKMCAACQREYDDPTNRRFHAQPNACPVCGPSVRLQEADGGRQENGYTAIQRTSQLLRDGKIVAIKGLGGYHLACDARNADAVKLLRTRKHRWDKPFALMVADLEAAKQLCEINETEEKLLLSRRRPIVLLHEKAPRQVAEGVAPKEPTLGIMLPYAPLHFLLLEEFGSVLVMTSGNLSDEPIAYRDDEAQERLSGLADAFLFHNREIFMRCDDSVFRVVQNREIPLRRSRGYVPEPLKMPVDFERPVLAVGGHLKNTFCLVKGHHAFVSHHIGDLENYETLRSFGEGIEHFKRLFDVAPHVVAHDLHPEYLATKYALDLDLLCVGVQHHHAHIAAVTAEHGIAEPVIGVAFDGTGYGTDGTIWGGEFLIADWQKFERVAHWQTLPLLGGAEAIHQVWRLAAAWLHQVYGDEFLNLDLDFVRRLDRQQWRVLQQMESQNINAPQSSAMGRLFDAVAALIGLRDSVNYEAQAAIELELLADESCEERYGFDFLNQKSRVIGTGKILRGIVCDLQNEIALPIIAAKFHNTVVAVLVVMCGILRKENGINQVALGGGVFQNALLLKRILSALEQFDFEAFTPKNLPFNDGGLCFGQAVVANAVLKAGRAND